MTSVGGHDPQGRTIEWNILSLSPPTHTSSERMSPKNSQAQGSQTLLVLGAAWGWGPCLPCSPSKPSANPGDLLPSLGHPPPEVSTAPRLLWINGHIIRSTEARTWHPHPPVSLRNIHLGISPEDVGPLWIHKPIMTPGSPLRVCVPGPLKVAWPRAGHRAVESPRLSGSPPGAPAHLAVEASVALWAGALVGTIAVLAGATVQTGP